ncbi:glycosyltransferase family 39 protein [Phenylobacterium sp. LjRoot225]|uniref:glycosyltransferase family 39 protein n=1 Tax=Phenylobacterium sp. LjRoot225 TaxID=3342285 RepID=UPI003ECFC0BF
MLVLDADEGRSRSAVAWDSRRPVAVAGLAALVALALALRLPGYLSPVVYVDEANTWYVVGHKHLSDYLAWSHHAEHPPGIYLVEEVIVRFFGDALWALRLPGLVAGLACVPAAWAFGRTAAGSRCGFWLALLLAVDPNMVQQSGFARMYAPFALELLLLCTLLVKLLRNEAGGLAGWVAAAALMAAALWTSSVALTLLPGLAVAFAILAATAAGPGRRRILLGGAAVLGGGVLSVAWGLTHRRGAHYDHASLEHQVFFSSSALAQITGGDPWWPLGLVAAAVGLAILWRRQKVAVLVTGGVALANLVCVFIILANFHHAAARHLSAVQPAIWLGWAGLAATSGPAQVALLRTGVVAAIAVIQLWWSTHLLQWYPRPATYAVSTAVKAVAAAGYRPNQVIYWPGWYYATPEYLRAPVDWDLQGWTTLSDAQTRLPRAGSPALAQPLALVVVVHEPPLGDEGRRLASGLARALGVRLDARTLAARFQPGMVTVVGFADGRAEFRSFKPNIRTNATSDGPLPPVHTSAR